ncbi:MAG: hypothetical protein QF600_07710 [Verrucomicrobiota bacterium]|nr:hypothetical protein [Verrucomicrobiota bacterium]
MKKKNEGWAAYNLGRAYHLGTNGAKKNETKAAAFYRIGAEAGYAKAQANLGYCYETGFGVEQDPQEAGKWYHAAALQGNRYAQMNHANKLLKAALETKDENGMIEAREWYLKAHYQDKTLTQAAYGIGVVYAQLQSKSAENAKLAKRWFSLAAAGNHADAQFALGYLEENSGNGRASFNWYKLAKTNGSRHAVFNLGRCFENGFGVAQNSKLAQEHYRLAAKSGHPQSQYALGLLIYNQAKTEADFREAHMWWSLAKMNALPSATGALQKLESSRLLSMDGIVAANNAAANFKPDPFHTEPSTDPSFNEDVVAGTDHEAFAASGFFVSRDGWLITSAKALSLDPVIHELEPGYVIKIVTEAGTFSVLDAIHLNKDESVAAVKVAGNFHPLPLSDSDEIAKEAAMFAVSLDSPAGRNFVPKILKGTVNLTGNGRRSEPFFTLNTTEIADSLSNFMVFNQFGQATGFALPPEHPNTTKLTAVKIKDIKDFLKNSIPDIALEESQAQKKPSEVVLMDHARRSTAMVVVYRE